MSAADQPRTLRWAVRAGGHTLAVETRDRHDWTDDHSQSVARVGALAEIPWSDPLSMSQIRCREAVAAAYAWGEPREVTHRRAVEMLCVHNGWTEIRDGDVCAVFAAEVQS
jgi:hypothetical protein